MIRLYRIQRSTNETLLSWQCSQEDLPTLQRLLHFPPPLSHNEKLFEEGYYAYIRGTYREERENAVLHYFRSHYTPPDVELLMFQSELQVDRSADTHNELVRDICKYYRSLGALVTETGLGHTIFGVQPKYCLTIGNIKLRRGVTFSLEVSDAGKLLLFTDVTHRVEMNGRFLKEEEFRRISLSYKDDLFAIRKRFSTLDTDEIFRLCQTFVSALPKRILEQYHLPAIPHNVAAQGGEIWLWCHELSLDIEVGEKRRVGLAQAISIDTGSPTGLHTPPEDKLIFVVVHPTTSIVPNCSVLAWKQVEASIRDNLSSMLPKHDVPVILIPYGDISDSAEVLSSVRKTVESFEAHKPIYILPCPPEADKGKRQKEDEHLGQFTKLLSRELRKIKRGSYVVSVNWAEFASNRDQQWELESAVIKGLTVIGATPWRIMGIPVPQETSVDDTCFIGIDVNIYREVPVVGGVIFDGYGVAKGYHLVKLTKPHGDHIGDEAFSLLTRRLLEHYCRITKTSPKYVVIHRDGLSDQDDVLAASLLQEQGFAIELVEIRKSGAPRIRQIGNFKSTPSQDIAVSISSSEAILNTTLVFRECSGTGNMVFPAPNTLTVKQVYGTTPLKLLAGQVYSLTLANYNSYRRTNRLPITTASADALVNNSNLRVGQSEHGKPIDGKTTLYWL